MDWIDLLFLGYIAVALGITAYFSVNVFFIQKDIKRLGKARKLLERMDHDMLGRMEPKEFIDIMNLLDADNLSDFSLVLAEEKIRRLERKANIVA